MAFASDKEALDALRGKHAELTAEIRKVIVGQEEVVEQVLVSVFSGGHLLSKIIGLECEGAIGQGLLSRLMIAFLMILEPTAPFPPISTL